MALLNASSNQLIWDWFVGSTYRVQITSSAEKWRFDTSRAPGTAEFDSKVSKSPLNGAYESSQLAVLNSTSRLMKREAHIRPQFK
jgi:hypothetical protein